MIVRTIEPPTVTFSNGVATAHAKLSAELSVDGNKVMRVDGEIQIDVSNVRVSGGRLRGKVQITTMSITDSELYINDDSLQSIIDKLPEMVEKTQEKLQEKIRDYVKNGQPMPEGWIQLQYLRVRLFPGTLLVSTDVVYNSPNHW